MSMDPEAPAAPAGPPPGAPDVSKLHDHAAQAEKHLEQLATGLGQVGADATAVKTVTQMADVLRKIATGLAKAGRELPPKGGPRNTDEATDQMMAERRSAAPPTQE